MRKIVISFCILLAALSLKAQTVSGIRIDGGDTPILVYFGGNQMKTIAIANQKGGTGKTTTAYNLGIALTQQGYRVLMVDFDPQGNLSMSMAADNQSGATMYEVMKGTVTAREAIQHTAACDIIPANTILAGIEQELHSVGKEMTLREKLRDEESGVADDYDYILIDCPPSLGLLTVNALTAADYLLIPTMAETFAASGITQLYDTFRSVKKYTNPALKIDGVLLTRTERTRVTKTIQELTGKIAEYMGADVYRTTIRSNVIIKEAQAAQENVFDYVEGKSQTKGERVTESSRNFVGDCLAFVREFVEKEREQ